MPPITAGEFQGGSSGGSGGGGSGTILAIVSYAPSIPVTYTSTSDVMAAMDATNLTTPVITAPTPGRLLFRLNAVASGASTDPFWGIMDHTSGALYGSPSLITNSSAANLFTRDILVSGLTPNSTYQFDWGFANGANTGSAHTYAGNGGGSLTVITGDYGPALMEVIAA